MFGNENCTECVWFRTNPEVGASAQLKLVDQNPKRRRNRRKIGVNFVATLPETDGHEQSKKQLKPDTLRTRDYRNEPEKRTTDRKTSEGAGGSSSRNTADTGAGAKTTGGGRERKPRRISSITYRPEANLSGGAHNQDWCSEAIQTQTTTNPFRTTPVPRAGGGEEKLLEIGAI